ncbi:MAG: thiamine-phosphate kinase [Actinomycetota bacterium]
MKLSDLGEFGFIQRVRRWLPASPAALGLLDDAAVIDVADIECLVVTTDVLVEGVHFHLGWSKPDDVGFKSIAVSVSDLAAMGAQPRWVLVGIGAPPTMDEAVLEGLYAGIAEACVRFGVEVIGGDTARATELIVDVTALGVATDEPVRRSGARPGDVLAVTGPLGRAAAGVELLRIGRSDDGPACVEAHRKPSVRVDLAATLRASGVHAAMDISDGLGSDAQRIAEASGVGVEIDADRVPIADDVRDLAVKHDWDVLSLALGGGEDYELLVAGPADAVEAAGFIVVGRVIDDGAWLVVDGTREPLGEGYDNFRSGISS